MQPLRIAIVGAGTAGLAAAAFLARDGHSVELLERFEAAQPIGAGLMLQPTGLVVLAALGVGEMAHDLGRVMQGIKGQTIKGRTIFDVRYDVLGSACHGLAMHRAALFETLRTAAERAGVRPTCAVEVVSSSLSTRGRSLISRTGATFGPYDLVVDASGTRSALRDELAAVRFNWPYPYGAVWAVVEEPKGWPLPNHLAQRYDGAHTMIGLLPLGRRPGDPRALTAFFWSLPVAAYPEWRETPFPRWRERVGALWPEAIPFIAELTHHDDLTFARYADILVDPPISERIAFIGDAARSASPQLGQGANLALIDALVLVASLRSAPSLEAALGRYAEARRRHTRFYALASRLLTPFFQSDSRIAGWLRDLTFAPAACLPFVHREMVRTLAGMKTGLFTHLTPAALVDRAPIARPPWPQPAEG